MVSNVIFCEAFSLSNFFFSGWLSKLINYSIIFLTLFAFIRIMVANRRLKNERKNHLSFVKIIKEHLIDKNLEAIVDKINNQKITGVSYNRFNSLYSQKTSNVKVDLESIDSVNKSNGLPSYHIPFFISNILISLGLLGTIAGLAMSLSVISDALTVEDIKVLQHSLIDVLSGINTAFSTTIMGISGSVIVIYKLNRSKKLYFNILDEINGYFLTDIRKLFFEEEEKEIDYSELLKQNLKLNNEIAEKLVIASKAVSSQNENLIAFSATLKKSLLEVIEPFKNIKVFQEEILGAISTYKNIASSIGEGSNKIVDKTDLIIQSLTGMVEQLKLQHTDVSTVINKNSELSNDFNKVINKINDTITQLNTSFGSLTKGINEVNKLSVNNMAQLDVSLKNVKEIQVGLLNEFAKNADAYFKQITENVDKNNLEFKQSLENLQATYQKNYDGINDVSVNAITNIQVMVQNNFNVILENYQKLAEENKKAQEEIINKGFTLIITKFEQVLTTLDKKIDDIKINTDNPRIESSNSSKNNSLLVEAINKQEQLLSSINYNIIKMRKNWIVRLWEKLFYKEK